MAVGNLSSKRFRPTKWWILLFSSTAISLPIYCCWCSVTKLCQNLFDTMNCSIPGFSVLHYLLEFAETYVHWVSDAIYFILCHPLLILPSIFPSIRDFSNELALCIKWPKYWSFSFSISPSSEYSELSLYLSIVLKIFLFLALLGLCCCTGFSLAAMLGFLIAVASFVERGLSRASGLQ